MRSYECAMKQDGVHRVGWASCPPDSASRGIHSGAAGELTAGDHPPGTARDARNGRRDAHPTRDMSSCYLPGYLCWMESLVHKFAAVATILPAGSQCSIRRRALRAVRASCRQRLSGVPARSCYPVR